MEIECRTKSPEEVDFIQTFNDAFNMFKNDISRIKFISQILLYCTYYQKDQDQIMHFLKLFMDQPFDDAFKYRHLIVHIIKYSKMH